MILGAAILRLEYISSSLQIVFVYRTVAFRFGFFFLWFRNIYYLISIYSQDWGNSSFFHIWLHMFVSSCTVSVGICFKNSNVMIAGPELFTIFLYSVLCSQ